MFNVKYQPKIILKNFEKKKILSKEVNFEKNLYFQTFYFHHRAKKVWIMWTIHNTAKKDFNFDSKALIK